MQHRLASNFGHYSLSAYTSQNLRVNSGMPRPARWNATALVYRLPKPIAVRGALSHACDYFLTA